MIIVFMYGYNLYMFVYFSPNYFAYIKHRLPPIFPQCLSSPVIQTAAAAGDIAQVQSFLDDGVSVDDLSRGKSLSCLVPFTCGERGGGRGVGYGEERRSSQVRQLMLGIPAAAAGDSSHAWKTSRSKDNTFYKYE